MTVEIPLAPPSTLGRLLQYAFLSLAADKVTVDPAAGLAVFESPSIYVAAVQKAVNSIIGAAGVVKRRGCKSPGLSTPLLGGRDCCSLPGGPQLYAAGRKEEADQAVFQAAGLDMCHTVEAGKKRVSWNAAAVSYALRVIQSGGPLDGGERYPMPWLARATFFSYERAPGGSRTPGYIVELDTLGTILLGGSLAHTARAVVDEERRTMVEAYLLPDYVIGDYEAYRGIALLRGPAGNPVEEALGLARRLPVSLEAAFALTLTSTAASVGERARLLQVSTAARIHLVSTGNRPTYQGSLIVPVDALNYYSDETLRVLLDLARTAARSRRTMDVEAASSCINGLFLQAQAPCQADHLAGCMRILAALAMAEGESRSYTPRARNLAARLLGLLEEDYSRMTSMCGGGV